MHELICITQGLRLQNVLQEIYYLYLSMYHDYFGSTVTMKAIDFGLVLNQYLND